MSLCVFLGSANTPVGRVAVCFNNTMEQRRACVCTDSHLHLPGAAEDAPVCRHTQTGTALKKSSDLFNRAQQSVSRRELV